MIGSLIYSKKFPEVIQINSKRYYDHRGYFCESYRQEDMDKYCIPQFVQENHSRSVCGTLRGLHYQLNPKAQAKLVYALNGMIWDYVVDIREGSPTFGKWDKFILDSNNDYVANMLYIPPGFAHGFYVPDFNGADVIYKVSEYWSPEHERSIRWDDPDLGIDWCGKQVKISEKDANAPLFKDLESNFIYK